MKINKILAVSVLAVALLGCGKREPRHIVILPDVSGSIERESLEQVFKAIDELAGHLQRGDRLTIIPILGDAEAEASGRILRFEIPANRQAYDADLRDFRTKLSSSLKAMEADATAHPGARTDIFGSIALAEQEFRIRTAHSTRLLVILSDFIEEDAEINFRNNHQLANETTATQLARRSTAADQYSLSGVAVYLGFLRSTEYATLSQRYRKSIQMFWTKYFELLRAEPRLSADGIGLVNDFIGNGYGNPIIK
jgi:hypothetical protein